MYEKLLNIAKDFNNKKNKINDKIKITFLLFCVGLLVIFMGFIRCMIGYDILQNKLYFLDFDLWSLSHIIVFFIITYN